MAPPNPRNRGEMRSTTRSRSEGTGIDREAQSFFGPGSEFQGRWVGPAQPALPASPGLPDSRSANPRAPRPRPHRFGGLDAASTGLSSTRTDRGVRLVAGLRAGG